MTVVPSLVQLFGRSIFAPEAHGHIARQVAEHICEIDIQFPKNAGPMQFEADRARWINVDDFDRILLSFEKRGMRRTEVFHSNSMQVVYRFPTAELHHAFADVLNSRNAVNDAKLASIGYKFSRRSFAA